MRRIASFKTTSDDTYFSFCKSSLSILPTAKSWSVVSHSPKSSLSSSVHWTHGTGVYYATAAYCGRMWMWMRMGVVVLVHHQEALGTVTDEGVSEVLVGAALHEARPRSLAQLRPRAFHFDLGQGHHGHRQASGRGGGRAFRAALA